MAEKVIKKRERWLGMAGRETSRNQPSEIR
jgi:hypothetical protein